MGLINDKTDSVEVLFDKDLKDKKLLAVHPNTNKASILITPEELEKFVKSTNHEIEYR